jgi:hypothetical protein
MKTLRTEDPSRIAAFAEALKSLAWDEGSYRASLDVLFSQISTLAQCEIQYYYERRSKSRRTSMICRFLAWTASAVGILIPLIHLVCADAPKTFLSWGYLAFGLVGVVLIFDTLFDGTQAHQRYSQSQLEVEKAYTIFAIEWQALLLGLTTEKGPSAPLKVLDRAVAFASELHRVLGSDTSLWQQTVNKGLTDLSARVGGATAAKGG